MTTKTFACFAMLLLAAGLWAGAAWAADAACQDDDDGCWLRQLDGAGPAALQAAMKLGARQSTAAVPALIKKLESKDQYMATAATQALIKIGPPAAPELVKATGAKSAAVRRYAAYALGKIGGQDAFAALVKAARDEDKNVRQQAAAAFGVMQDTRAVAPLLDLLRDRSAGVRAEAATALGAYGDAKLAPPLIEYGLCDLSPEVALAATNALTALGEPAVEPLVGDFNARPSFARQRILLTLGALAAKSEKARARAAQTAVWVLPRKNESSEVRAAAAFVAGNLEAKDAVPALKATLAEAKDATDGERQQLAAACRTALDKIYQRHKLAKDY